jgi:heme/copper-type cytochrome/quinol oxidase subunit 2
VSGDTSLQHVKKGQRVAIVVTSDVADEIHLHTYDVKKDVPAGGTATLAFTATIQGRFECELENRSKLLTRIEVK